MNDIGRGYGCGVAVIIGVLPILPLAFVLGWSGAHCDPIPSCQRSAEWHIGLTFVVILVFASIVGWGVRQLVNRLAATREDEGYSASFSRIATTLSLAVIAMALGLLFTIASS